MLRFCFGILLIAGLLIVQGCSNGGSTAGIEIGNPGITVSADVSVEYGERDFSALAKEAQGNFVLTDFTMPVLEVCYHASDYINEGLDPEEGLVIYSADSSHETSVNFIDGHVPPILETMELATRRLKDIELKFALPEFLEGKLRDSEGTTRVFRMQMESDTLNLRFHNGQLDTISEDLYDLHIRFFVRDWLMNQPLLQWADSLETDTLLLKSEGQDSAFHHNLLQSFLKSFSSLSATLHQKNGETQFYVDDRWAVGWNELGDDIIRNGDFSDSLDNWIFFKQQGGMADIISDSAGIVIQVDSGGSRNWSLQLLQEDLIVLEGHRYTLSVELETDREIRIGARVAQNYSPYKSYSYDVSKQAVPGNNTLVWTVNDVFQTDYFARLEINLGQYDDVQIRIRRVKLTMVE